ncbi:glycosyltransferase family 52 [Acinetobacter baumannii]|uniref:glycosyltransferase family 52 n=1 Tax=Acinetobacter baumannii TaxID=470 RepID=UPI003CFD4E11
MENFVKKRALILCTTTLQMLLAKKIILNETGMSFDCILLTMNDNKKHKYYFNELSDKCENSLFFYMRERGLKNFFKFKKEFVRSGFRVDYDEYFIASVDNYYFRYILSKDINAKIRTFDDGVANIIPSSIYYQGLNEPFLKKIIWNILGVKRSIFDIIKSSNLHYTIYNNVNNIIPETRFIDILENKNNIHGSQVVKIFIGQPMHVIDNKFSISFIEKVLDKIKIDFYFPHPRECEYPMGDFEIIKTDYIFEDFIVNFLKDNPHVKLKLFSFISTASLNVASIEGIDINYIYDEILEEKYPEFYMLIKNKFRGNIIGTNCSVD